MGIGQIVWTALCGVGWALLWLAGSLLVIFLLLLLGLVLLRFTFLLRVAVDGLDVKVSVGASVLRLGPMLWSVHIFRKEDGFTYDIEGPFHARLKALADKLLREKQPQEPTQPQPQEQPNKQGKAAAYFEKVLGRTLAKARLEQGRFTGTIGIADDAMVCAMTCGTVQIFANALMAILSARLINQRPLQVCVLPAFNQNQFALDIQFKVSMKVLDGIKGGY